MEICTYRGLPQFSEDILRLCVKYKDQGVVGIDIAGDLYSRAGQHSACNLQTKFPRIMLVAGDEEGLDPKDDDMFEPSTYKVFFKPPTG